MARFDSNPPARLDAGVFMDQNIPPVIRRALTKGTMINFFKFFLNPFEDRQISFTEILNYAAAHLERLIHNNPANALDARITATTGALGGMETGLSGDMTMVAVQKAKTEAKNNFRDGLPAKIAQVYGAVLAAYGPDAPDLLECFPQGRSIFQNCRDEQLDNHLLQLVNCITPKQAQVGAAAVTLATTTKNSWSTIYSAQGTAKGAKSSSAEARNTALNLLRAELFTNLLTLAQMFSGDTDKCDLYCPQHLLRNRQAPGAPGTATLSAGAWNAGTHKVTLSMQSTGAETFTLQRRMQGEADFSVVSEDIDADAGGNGSYEDTLAGGHFEYRAVPYNGTIAGEASNIVIVNAA